MDKENSTTQDIFSSKNILKSFVTFFIAIITLIPGLLIGPIILIPWYLTAIFFMISGRIQSTIKMIVIWQFIKNGLYYYNLLGANPFHPLLQYFDEYLLLMLMAHFLLNNKSPSILGKNIYLSYLFVPSCFVVWFI